MILTWKKRCDCIGSRSTSPGFTIESLPESDRTVSIRITFTPGPVCDFCGEAWYHVAEEEDCG